MTEDAHVPAPAVRAPLWKLAWLVIAAAYAWPIVLTAYERIEVVTRAARERLIVEYRLWELHPEYAGTPETWTRFAARLLSDRQLLSRVRAKYGALAEQIEFDYRRDLFIAQAEVTVIALLAWGLPLAALYGIGLAVARRSRRRTPQQAAQPPADDPRYRA